MIAICGALLAKGFEEPELAELLSADRAPLTVKKIMQFASAGMNVNPECFLVCFRRGSKTIASERNKEKLINPTAESVAPMFAIELELELEPNIV